MDTQTLVAEATFKKADVLARYNIKNNAYYDRTKFLGIKATRTKEGSFLSSEQIELMDALDQHIKTTGKMEGFDSSSFCKGNNDNSEEGTGEIIKSEEGAIASEDNNNVERLEPEVQSFNPNIEKLMREAAELKASELAMGSLVKRAIADEMNYEDLPEDLREDVAKAKEISRPKSNPAQVNSIAKNLLSQYRKQGGN